MDSDQKIVLTKDGLKHLKEEYQELIEKKRPEAVERLSNARSEGDLTENSEYTAAKQDLAFIDGRITELKIILSEAKVIATHSKKKVDVGCKVTLYVNGKREIFTIVGEWEADPMQKKISHSSPLGKALIGKKPGEQVEVDAPVGKILYKVLQIH
ncbi:transcription elongation factor GreA [Candidatus Gottesmanbacteria bacterium RIFCSPHIGHO2_02_FULL_40_24]|uniref:Transcription elongation factor GreA n=1 Tax=Candidatus Gottesmanbacteria bacterium RIFCSPHIGHO2_01_FULL_40_15 TaxID=1798376 RepID=A0A1F5Z0M1_9BACT|nr:MAG: transcription elongation factor GreA [Candidatus Gottesmanbacteria bacterium RIFCSPHIGHO2_01_FULL_40_15]OGG18516.1 MAG: transcription elongation factor GreA [Candidatus Gottesmanbacteria bacterium RIFCSPHIGHO2_02_FULL_40_24]OGG24871.1 MAG: transcription elongation factor GreA [Candidatus Gottesmanbacteria bacterium RIFCSPHIGHO2_12_FULL_40_13]OGG33707.1 MAG: transcription elongation factor GreA [Candidatus Gottesmanbacteria bacterium RIFCSPLOWO2_02_FULL_40_10]